MANRLRRFCKALKKPFAFVAKHRLASKKVYEGMFLRPAGPEEFHNFEPAGRALVQRAAEDGNAFTRAAFYRDHNSSNAYFVGAKVEPIQAKINERIVGIFLANARVLESRPVRVSSIQADKEKVRIFNPFSNPAKLQFLPDMRLRGVNYMHMLPVFLDEAMRQARETGAKIIEFETESSSIAKHLIEREGFKPMEGKKSWLEKRLA
jgi:hypothetical protein